MKTKRTTTNIFDEELINFATQFSDNYKKLSCGEYYSDNRKYHIKYLKRIVDGCGNPQSTGARVGHTTGVIELDKFIYKNKKYTSNFLFFIILWCVVMKSKKNLKLADKMAIKYYLNTNRSKKHICQGCLQLFSTVPTILNKERYKIIVRMLDGKLNQKFLKSQYESYDIKELPLDWPAYVTPKCQVRPVLKSKQRIKKEKKQH